MSNASPETIPGTKAIAARMVRAEENFIATLMTLGEIDQAAAERVFAYYHKVKATKMDVVGGRITVKHGALLDRETIRKAAGL